MKTIMVTLAALCIALAGMAQNTLPPLKPVKGNMGYGFTLNGVLTIATSNWQSTGLQNQLLNDPLGVFGPSVTVGQLVPQEMIFGRYYLKDNLALRYALGINSVRSVVAEADSIGGGTFLEESTNTRAFSFGLSAGVEHHFKTNARRLDPYIGGQFNIGLITPIKQTYEAIITGNGSGTTTAERKWQGGTSYGIDALFGANIFLAEGFAVGVESNLGFGGLNFGGDYSEIITSTSGNTTISTTNDGNQKASTNGFRVGNSTLLRVAVFF